MSELVKKSCLWVLANIVTYKTNNRVTFLICRKHENIASTSAITPQKYDTLKFNAIGQCPKLLRNYKTMKQTLPKIEGSNRH
jgi:hypothetical protein